MAREWKVCLGGCTGGRGEVAVVGAERVPVSGVASSTALVRCSECQRISIAGVTIAFSKKNDMPQKAEVWTPLGPRRLPDFIRSRVCRAGTAAHGPT